MRNMSFSLTKKQILNQSKTVTRRLGWMFLREGDLVQPVEKCMGLKKGEKVKRLGCPIRVIEVHRTLVKYVNNNDLIKEGFPGWNTWKFVKIFCIHMKCKPDDKVTRIEFEYTEEYPA